MKINMIKSFKISNFYSIGEDSQLLSFAISAKDSLEQSSSKIDRQYINLVNCFIGHNASGKTTILKAISFLLWLINNAYTSTRFDEKIPLITHQLFHDQPTKIEMEFFNGENHYLYKLVLNKSYIEAEFLGKKLTRSYSRIFEYTRSGKEWNFQKLASMLVINKNDLSRFKDRHNVPVLSSLIETGYLPELLFLRNFKSNITEFGHVDEHRLLKFSLISEILAKDINLRKESLNFVKDIDLGIASFNVHKFSKPDHDNPIVKAVEQHWLECKHESSFGKITLPLIFESNGTRHSLQIFLDILPVLQTGGVVILDEIEAGLHPYTVKKIIYLFENPKTNPKKAQLIFSTHQHLLLNDRTKTQIFLVEKENTKFQSEVYRLDEVEGVRNDENYFQKYLAGAYGAIPNIKWN